MHMMMAKVALMSAESHERPNMSEHAHTMSIAIAAAK